MNINTRFWWSLLSMHSGLGLHHRSIGLYNLDYKKAQIQSIRRGNTFQSTKLDRQVRDRFTKKHFF